MKHLVWTLVLVASLVATAQAEPLRHVKVAADDARAVAVELERAGFDVLEGSVTDKSLELIVSEPYLQLLKDLGYEPETLAIGRPFRDILAEQAPDLPPGYLDLNGLYAEMTAKATAYPSICQMVDVTALYGAPTTVEGRHLFAVKVSDNVASDEDEPAVLIVSCHHAREVVTPVIALHALNQLTSQYGSDPNITAAVNNNEIWIAPVWNPDGYNYMYNTDNMWRKNRHVFAGGTGVDLNRNYPMGWDSACSGDTNPASETYKGPSAASEAETQTMIAWSQGRHFHRVIDYHSSGREVLYSYNCLTHPHTAYLQSEAAALATASGYGGATRAPSAEGEHYEWQLAYMGAAANLIETHTEFQPSYASAQAEAALVWPGILWAIQRTVPLWGYVTNALTGEPIVNATINYVGAGFSNGEYNHSGRFGRYHGYLPAGTYMLSVAAPGYEPLTVSNVVVTTGQSLHLDLPMSPPPVVTYPNGGEQLPISVPADIAWTNVNPTYRYHVQVTTNWGQIGNLTDSFERTSLGADYQTGGNANWAISSQFALVGTRSARAGVIAHNQTTWMSRTASQGNFSFWYLVSSEANGDYFNFYVDGNRVVHASGTGGGWQSYSTTLSAGNHTVKWEYTKNASVTSGNDSVWVDYVQMVSDTTPWTDVIALTPYGATSTSWTPTVLSNNCKVRVRSYHADATYGPWGESAATFSVVESLPICRGDCDCDNDVDFDDIGFFVAALGGEQAWIDMHMAQLGQPPSCQYANCDVDASGVVDFDDINPLIARLGQGCP